MSKPTETIKSYGEAAVTEGRKVADALVETGKTGVLAAIGATDVVVGLDDHDVPARIHQRVGGDETVRSRADHHRVRRVHRAHRAHRGHRCRPVRVRRQPGLRG